MHIREVSPIVWVRRWPKVIILCPNKAEIMFMTFFTSKIVELRFLRSLEGMLTSVCIFSRYLMFMHKFLGIK